MSTNAYGVSYPYDADDHPTYTIDAHHACNARKWGGTHTCSCVYRKRICDGINHLCMCGDTWTSAQTYLHCWCDLTPREKETTPMATPVGIEISAHQGEFTLSVSMSAETTIHPGSVLTTQLERAAKAMAVLLDTSRPSSDDEDPDF